jgi:hypothetical protein
MAKGPVLYPGQLPVRGGTSVALMAALLSPLCRDRDVTTPISHTTTFFPVSASQLFPLIMYRGADKSLARPTSRCILFDENISFDASLVLYVCVCVCVCVYIYIYSTNILPVMIINRIYQNLLSL